MSNIRIFLVVLLVMALATMNFSCSWFNGEGEESSNDTIVEIIDQDINHDGNGSISYEAGDYSIPDELKYSNQADDFLVNSLYPIGWSKDGKFAYIVEPADEGSGFYLFELIVFDLVNNTVVWSWKPKESEEGDLETTWKENYGLFKESLNKFEIVGEKNYELKNGKTSYKGNEYQIVLETKTETEPDFGFDVVKEMKILIKSPEIGTKEIFNHKEKDYSMVVGAYIPGYLLSPFDGRIVVICQMERWGYEGPPNVVFFELIGSDLLRGFKVEDDS